MKSACSLNLPCHTQRMKRTKTKKTESNQRDSSQPHTQSHSGRKIGYVRVSDADQSENLQVDALKQAGCDIIYGDHGVSGAIKNRRSLERLMRDLGPGDVLVVWKLDRLSRSTLHLLQLMEDFRQNGIDLIVLTQGIDTTTATGRMIFGHLAVFAEFEREQIRERTKAGMAAAKARGVHIGRPRAIPPDVAVILRERLENGTDTLETLAEELHLAPTTIARAAREVG